MSSSTAAKGNTEYSLVCADDPLQWSQLRKAFVLTFVSFVSLITTQAANVQNPAVVHMEAELHASPAQISWSLSLYILLQGIFPSLWSVLSELKGRKVVYLASLVLFTASSIAVALAPNMAVIISMRCVEGIGGSAVFAIGAATLADIYEPEGRGVIMGIYHAAPSLGRALAPLVGGALTIGFSSWRAIYWHLVIAGSVTSLFFLLFYKETFRGERSLAYQAVVKSRTKEQRREFVRLPPAPPQLPAIQLPPAIFLTEIDLSRRYSISAIKGSLEQEPSCTHTLDKQQDIIEIYLRPRGTVQERSMGDVKLKWKDVTPFIPLSLVLGRLNNVLILNCSGLVFGFFYSISYTAGRTLGRVNHFNSLQIGLVILSYGIGSICGSLSGGRWSDFVLSKIKEKNGGIMYPEMRLESSKLAMLFLPLSVAGYAWSSQKDYYVAIICAMLFLSGFFSMWIYASTLSYLVDANAGRTSTVVAADGAFRGISAFVAAEIAIPIQDKLGDGWMYTLWACLLAISELLVLLTIWRGKEWRIMAEAKEGG